MEKHIVDPNREGRIDRYIVVSFAICIGLMMALFGEKRRAFGIFLMIFMTCFLPWAPLERPYAVLSPEGVTVRPFLKKETIYSWQELFQVGIIGPEQSKEGNKWRFPIVLLLPGASERKGRKDQLFLARNWRYRVLLPNTDEIREYLLTHYGPLDFNDIEKLNDWEKKYYHFD